MKRLKLRSQQASDEQTQYYNDLGNEISKVFGTILMVSGSLGHVMSILVLGRKAMRRSLATSYLIALAVVDLIVLYTGLLRMWIMAFFELDLRHLSLASCKINKWLVYVTLDISVWLVVALTFERLATVFLPHQVKKYCTNVMAFTTKAVTIVFFMAVNSVLLFMYGRTYRQEGGKKVVDDECGPLPGYEYFDENIWPWIDYSLYSLIPLVIVSVSNTAIIIKVYNDQRQMRHVHPDPSTSRPGSEQPGHGHTHKMSSMTVMLLVLNSVLLITTVPISLYYIVLPFVTSKNDSEADKARTQVVHTGLQLLMYTNNCINFFLYCISGSRFREELCTLLHCKRWIQSDRCSSSKSRTMLHFTRSQPAGKGVGSRTVTSTTA